MIAKWIPLNLIYCPFLFFFLPYPPKTKIKTLPKNPPPPHQIKKMRSEINYKSTNSTTTYNKIIKK